MLFGGNSVKSVEKMIEKQNLKGLVKASKSKKKDVRLAAIAGLGKVSGDDAFNRLVGCLFDNDPDIRIAVVKAFAEKGDRKAAAHIAHQIQMEFDQGIIDEMHVALKSLQSLD
ncbi:MAG: HEAT repeat domain-containing protein [Christensenellales bacterium]|jgi:HEAT repeat protein